MTTHDLPPRPSLLVRVRNNLARLLVAVVTLYLVFESVSWRSVLNAYGEAHLLSLLIGASLVSANLWIRTAKWHYMLRATHANVSRRDAFWSLMLGISFGAVTPGEIGEFAGRALHISGARKGHLVGLALLDRFHIFLIWIAFGVPSLAVILGQTLALQLAWSAGAMVAAVLIFLHLDWVRRIGTRVNERFFKRGWLERILDGFGCLSPAQRRVTLVFTAAFHLVLCVQMYFFLNAFTAISMWHATAGTSGLMLIKAMLPISLGDLGIRELTSVYLFGWFGVPQAAAVNASLLMFVVNVVLPGLFGVLSLRRIRSSRAHAHR